MTRDYDFPLCCRKKANEKSYLPKSLNNCFVCAGNALAPGRLGIPLMPCHYEVVHYSLGARSGSLCNYVPRWIRTCELSGEHDVSNETKRTEMVLINHAHDVHCTRRASITTITSARTRQFTCKPAPIVIFYRVSLFAKSSPKYTYADWALSRRREAS